MSFTEKTGFSGNGKMGTFYAKDGRSVKTRIITEYDYSGYLSTISTVSMSLFVLLIFINTTHFDFRKSIFLWGSGGNVMVVLAMMFAYWARVRSGGDVLFPWKELILMFVSIVTFADVYEPGGIHSLWKNGNWFGTLISLMLLSIVCGWHISYIFKSWVWEPFAAFLLYMSAMAFLLVTRSHEIPKMAIVGIDIWLVAALFLLLGSFLAVWYSRRRYDIGSTSNVPPDWFWGPWPKGKSPWEQLGK